MYPLGASYDGAGVNFALFSQVAQKVELCLFDEEDRETRVEMTGRTPTYGITICREYNPGNGTAIVCTVRMIQAKGLRCTEQVAARPVRKSHRGKHRR